MTLRVLDMAGDARDVAPDADGLLHLPDEFIVAWNCSGARGCCVGESGVRCPCGAGLAGHDPGDEHRDPPPAPIHPITALLEEWRAAGKLDVCTDSPEWVDRARHAEIMRSCCAACALEICGEDGS